MTNKNKNKNLILDFFNYLDILLTNYKISEVDYSCLKSEILYSYDST